MKHKLPPLKWSTEALEPHISRETIDHHYDKHHRGYLNKLNAAIEGTEYEDLSLVDIILKAKGSLFNNAAQVWNHNFYWNCLTGNSLENPLEKPNGVLLDMINAKWGSFEEFKIEFSNAALTNFGSGWTWLIEDNGELAIMNTSNADTPVKYGKTALLTIDIWEHAYYIDYRNRRDEYIKSFWHLVNWSFVNI